MNYHAKEPRSNATDEKILVMGVGNLILNDEGVGIHIIKTLSHLSLPPRVDLLDGGTGGLALLETLQHYQQLILIDATLDNRPVGTIRRLTPRYSRDYPSLLSAHEIGLKEMIDAMLLLGHTPHIELLVVTVRNCNRVGMQLSPEVRRAVPQLLQHIFDIIGEMREKLPLK